MKILLVEDHEEIWDFLSRRLRRRGFEVVVATDGQQGLDKAGSEKPDLMLLDMNLPIMDGWTVAGHVKAAPATAAIPIIALTAHAMSGDREKALAAGCDDYHPKPIDFGRLVAPDRGALEPVRPTRMTTAEAAMAQLLADNDLLRRQLKANSDAHQMALADLRASEERLDMALSAGEGVGTWDWDIVGDRVVADARFARLYGVDPLKAAAGVPIASFLDGVEPDDLAVLRRTIEETMRVGGPFAAEYRLQQPDGSVRWVAAQGHCILDAKGTPIRFPGVAFDITARKHAEDQLRVLNATLEKWVEERTRERDQLWELSEDLLVVADFEGRLIKTSPSWTRLLGRSEKDLVNQRYADIVHPADLITVMAAIRRMRETGKSVTFEDRLGSTDGSWKWLSWTLSPEPNGMRLIGIGRDITLQKQRQAALLATEDALRHSQKMEAVGQLTGGVAHDFNNLLTVIRSSVDLLKRPNLPDERRSRYVEAISTTTTRAAKLTGQLLAFARRQALKPEIFDVRDSVSAIGDMMGTLTGSRIAIRIVVPDQSCTVDTDPNQFDTALVNLAVNARDAMEGEGTLTIAVGTADGIPQRRAHPAIDGDFVFVTMTDTGSGIDPGDLDRIFEPFFTTKGVGHGTGLGLSQVFGFVKQSGGEVGVDSEPGRGTVFTLYLPRVAGAARTVEPVDLTPMVDGHGTRVLVVEDNVDVGSFATQSLEALGYRSVLARDATTALAELDRGAEDFDVVFSDVVMPGMNGIDLAQAIGERYADLPVILTSGYSHVLAQDGTHGLELLHKPYSIEQLSQVLTRAAHWRRLRRTLPS